MTTNVQTNFFRKYHFNPFQFAGDEGSVLALNRRIARYFDTCKSILDLGCGSGGFLQLMNEMGKRSLGVDAFDEAIKLCNARGLRVVHSEITQYLISHKDDVSQFDGVCCTHVIEHMQPTEVFDLFTSLYESMAPGTRLVLTTPNFEDIEVSGSIFWLDLTHVRPYPGSLAKQMLEATGFRSVSYKSIYGLGFSRTFIKRFILEKVRFGNRILRPNLIISATR